MNTPLTHQDAAALAAAINQRNAHTTHRAEAAASVLLAVVLALLGAMAVVHFLSPCAAEGALCSLLTLVKPRSQRTAPEEAAPPAPPRHPDDRLTQALESSYRQGHDDGEFTGYTEGWRWGLFNGVVIGIALGAFAVFSAYHAGWLLGH